jgi:hypothetical protein
MIWQATRLVILASQDLHVAYYEIDQESMILPDSYWDEEEMETFTVVFQGQEPVCVTSLSHEA